MKENRKEAEFKKEKSVIYLKGFIAEILSTKVGEKGLLTSLEFSKQCNYMQLEQYLKKLEKKEVLVHKKCRRDFTDIKRSLQYSDVTASKPKKIRSSMKPFSWKTCCFLCSKEAGEMTNILIESRFSI